jgi:PAS domain S-box-containing protein
MNLANVIQSPVASRLSIAHKPIGINPVPYYQYDTVLQTDLDFNIIGWNVFSRELNGYEVSSGKNLFDLVDIGFLDGDFDEFRQHLLMNGFWKGEMSLKSYDGEIVYYRTTAAHISDAKGEPLSILIVGENISELKKKEFELKAEEKKYEVFMSALPEGFMVINTKGNVETCNKKGAEILGYREDELLGKAFTDLVWDVVDIDGLPISMSAFPAIVSLQTGLPQRDLVIGIKHRSDDIIWLSMNSEPLIHEGEVMPYASVIYYADITEAKKTKDDLKKSHELVDAVSKITSDADAVWEFDPATQTLNRSEGFFKLSGYTPEQMHGNLNWWLSKIHPGDRERVKNEIYNAMESGADRWESQYWFECADGSYKFLSDYAVIIKKDGVPVREVGAIKDLTQLKNLENQLLEEQVRRKKAVAEATILGQESEKISISRELHDNVNQILMSAKLFMDMAKKRPEQTDELLDKAIEYQMMALQEIRKLSHSMNSMNIKRFKLKRSVSNIVSNMKVLKKISVKFSCGKLVEDKLTDDQKLMLFRVIQEQTNNIIKYAEGARSVQIKISEVENVIHMLIIDDGKGFDINQVADKGIGFINIRSRAEAHDGMVNIISAPDRGCTLELFFPLKEGSL